MTQPTTDRSAPARALLAAALAAVIAVSGLLRSFHDATPRLALLPRPFGSLLFLALLGLGALHWIHRRRGADRFPDGATVAPTLATALPLVVVVLGEKWFSTDLLDSSYDWIFGYGDGALADALYRLFTALGLTGAALALVFVLRQSHARLALYLAAHRARTALLLAGCGAAVTALVVLAGGAAAGGTLGFPALPRTVYLTATAAQVVRGAAEELFYRGLLQTGLVQLLIRWGMADRRPVRLIGILAVSAGFVLEHVDPDRAPADQMRGLLYVLGMSVALGTLLEVSRNLYVAALAHVGTNLMLAGLLPTMVDATARPVVAPSVAAVVFIVILFAGVTVAHRGRRPGEVSAAGGGSAPPRT